MTTDPSVDERTIEANFRDAVERHDIAFAMSDDHRVYRRGLEDRKLIEAHAKLLPIAVAVRIWNEVVDTKFVPEARQYYYWEVPE